MTSRDDSDGPFGLTPEEEADMWAAAEEIEKDRAAAVQEAMELLRCDGPERLAEAKGRFYHRLGYVGLNLIDDLVMTLYPRLEWIRWYEEGDGVDI